MAAPAGQEQEEYKYKIVILGEPSVGKTSLVKAFVEKTFREDYLPTIGVSILIKRLSLDIEGKTVDFSLSLWDIAGQKKFHQMRATYFSGAKGAFIVGDLTRPDTFEKLDEWYDDLKKHVPGDIPVVLLANKSDLDSATDQALLDQIVKKTKAVEQLKTSAKIGDNVKKSFQVMTRAILGK